MIRCVRCGQPGFHREAVDRATGHIVARGVVCDPCWATTTAEAAELQRQFEALLDLGVNRDLANEVMIARIDARRAAKDPTP
jgi:hypothetical protein